MTIKSPLAITKKNILAWGLMGICHLSHAAEDISNNIPVTNKSYFIKLGATRVVYLEKSEGVSLSVTNPQDHPVLIATSFFAADKKNKGDYLATPPVFLLQANKSSEIRFIRTNPNRVNDRESINWVCVKSVPPQQDYNGPQPHANQASLTVNKVGRICLQVKYRPKGMPEEFVANAESISWKKQANTIIAKNNTPYYISVSSVEGLKIPEDIKLFAPGSEVTISANNFSGKSIKWRYISDFGANSTTLSSKLQ